MDEMSFSLVPAEAPVTIDGAKYVLREATAAAVTEYRNAQMRATRLDANGKVMGVSGGAEADLILLAHCLCNGDGKPVGLAVVNGWPHRVTDPLATRAKKMSGLVKEVEAEAKKSPPPSPTTSG